MPETEFITQSRSMNVYRSERVHQINAIPRIRTRLPQCSMCARISLVKELANWLSKNVSRNRNSTRATQ